MKASHTILAILFIASAAARAQVVPAATGPAGLPVSGTLNYDLRYSQTAQFGAGQDGQPWSFASGDASYENTGKRLPFGMQYGGGYGWDWANSSSARNVFQHLSLSQGIVGRAGSLTVSDNVIYSYQTPTTGFSGIPGTGEPIGGSGSTSVPVQTILSLDTRTLNNIAAIGVQGRLSYAWSLDIGGSSGHIRFIDNNGQDSDTLMAHAGATRRLDALNSISGEYSYSRYSFSGTDLALGTNSLLFVYRRQWNRQFTTSVSAGPEWIDSSGVSSTGSPASPGSTMLSLNASANFQLRSETAGVSYFHGTNSGAGYMLGAKIDNLSANFSRDFGRSLSVGVTGSYMRTSSLIAAQILPIDFAGLSNSKFGGVQATRRLGRYMNAFASYTAVAQSSSMQITVLNLPTNLLSGLYQVVGFGIGYSPQEMHLKK
jgi:hypothetical protein